MPHAAAVRKGVSAFKGAAIVLALALACTLPSGVEAKTPMESTSKALSSGAHLKHVDAKAQAPHTHDLSATMAAQYHAAHAKKQLAMKRLGVKATATETFQTQGKVSDSTGKDNRSTADMMPFLLPPIGLVILGTITGLVISIRKWQKIPSLPTQGRLDIKDVQASAARAGGMRTPPGGSKEMKTPWGP